MDGQVFRIEGAAVRVVHPPSHSHDHIRTAASRGAGVDEDVAELALEPFMEEVLRRLAAREWKRGLRDQGWGESVVNGNMANCTLGIPVKPRTAPTTGNTERAMCNHAQHATSACTEPNRAASDPDADEASSPNCVVLIGAITSQVKGTMAGQWRRGGQRGPGRVLTAVPRRVRIDPAGGHAYGRAGMQAWL
ncbi:hypothetical protein VM1G_01000 [Cytospora mali]|uniref:Uncharacterized protein n=1 Tax=Cytospora mali TaxID=578113 RepID=A0A194VKL5_CYTMA|nr:hypothetical protein VM1G_01000 [Valsa mali]